MQAAVPLLAVLALECAAVDATQPHVIGSNESLAQTQPTALGRPQRKLPASAVLLGLLLGAVVYMLALLPGRTNLLLVGVDRAPPGTVAARSDTLILTTFQPARPYVGALSIPRDLWVTVPGYGENRINTAHFFAEASQAGTGMQATKAVVSSNFGVDVDYVVRVRFQAIVDAVDALGGWRLHLEAPMSGYSSGDHILDGTQALAFVRDRAGSDDFARMSRTQLFLKSYLGQALAPTSWPRLPAVAVALAGGVDSQLPVWEWPALMIALLRVGPERIDGRVIDRSMAVGFTTSDGAQVLAPQWGAINPVLLEMFGQ